MTDAERKLWRLLRARQFAQVKFRRQVPIGPYVADFMSYAARLVIEVDGSQHAESVRDKVRDRWFEKNGFGVLRFWNNDVLQNLEGVATVILSALARRPTLPSPARGEGKSARSAAAARRERKRESATAADYASRKQKELVR